MSNTSAMMESSTETFLKIPKFFFTIMGCWPIESSKWSWLYHLYSFIVAYLVSYIFLITLTVDIYQSVGNLSEIADASYYFTTELTFVTKFMLFTFKKSKFRELLRYINNPIFSSHLKTQESFNTKWSKFATIYSTAFFGCCFLCTIFYAVFPLIDIDDENILPFRGWFPFDVKHSLVNRTIVYIYQIFGLMSAISVNATLDILPAIFMNIGCAQIEILKDNLENAIIRAVDDKESEHEIQVESNIAINERTYEDLSYEIISKEKNNRVHDILNQCVEHHMHILKLLADVEHLFGPGMLIQFIATGITMTITGLQLIVVPINSLKFLAVLSYLSAVTFQISCYCWNGHQVIIQSSSIGESCYNMDWYRCSPRVKSTIFIIMERSKRAVNMTAGNFFILSIATLTTILRTSYSYVAVLRRVYGDKEET